MTEGQPQYSEADVAEAERFNAMVTEGKTTPAKMAVIEKDKTPEEFEAGIVANQKLEKIMAPDFKHFGIRFMNIGEYNSLIKSQKSRSGEIVIFDQDASFRDYLEDAVNHGWRNEAQERTDWKPSLHNIEDSEGFLGILEQSHKVARQDSSDNIRTRTLDILREKLMFVLRGEKIKLDDYYPWQRVKESPLYGIARNWFDSEDRIEIVPNEDKDMQEWAEKVKKTKEFVGEENWDDLKRFCQDPKWVHQQGNLRRLYNIISSMPGTTRDSETNPYNVAVILNPGVAQSEWDPGNWGGKQEWRWLKKDQGQIGDRILGVVSLINNRDQWLQLISLNQSSPDTAHPVFDSRGHLIYPARKSEESSESQ